MSTDPLEVARRRRAALGRTAAGMDASPTVDCEISEISEESQASGGLISHNSLISQSVPVPRRTDDPLLRARQRVRELRGDGPSAVAGTDDEGLRRDDLTGRPVCGHREDADCEISEISEKRSADRPGSSLLADPFRAWRLRNGEMLAEADGRFGHDYGGFCAEHRRCLSYPEQKRGACSWCVPCDPMREPEYWASHWRRFTEKR
jgi:hypothetical protein